MGIRDRARQVSRGTAAVALAFAAALAAPAPARAETLGCTDVGPLPATITVPGTYCLAADVAQNFTGSSAIRIDADDVVLDCNGHRIRQTVTDQSGHGINAGDDQSNVTVRNCVVDGFYAGISVIQTFGSNHATTRLSGNTVLNARVYGILAYGSNLVIEDNRIDHVLGNAQGSGPSALLMADGTGSIVRRNTITDIRPDPPAGPASTTGISLQNVKDGTIEDNVVAGLTSYTGFSAYGIYGYNVSGMAVSRNVLVTPHAPGIAPLDGDHYRGVLFEGPEVAGNVCRDNVVGHYATDLVGCTNALNTEF